MITQTSSFSIIGNNLTIPATRKIQKPQFRIQDMEDVIMTDSPSDTEEITQSPSTPPRPKGITYASLGPAPCSVMEKLRSRSLLIRVHSRTILPKVKSRPFPLMNLPREIRRRIAEYVLHVPEGLDWQWIATMPVRKYGTFRNLHHINALPRVSKRLHEETSGLIFKINVLNFDASCIYGYIPQTEPPPDLATALFAFEFFWSKCMTKLRGNVQRIRLCTSWTASQAFELSLCNWPSTVRQSMKYTRFTATRSKKEERSHRILRDLAQSRLHVMIAPLDWRLPNKNERPKSWRDQLDKFVAFAEGLKEDELLGWFGGGRGEGEGERKWRITPYHRGCEEDLEFLCFYVSYEAYTDQVRGWCSVGF